MAYAEETVTADTSGARLDLEHMLLELCHFERWTRRAAAERLPLHSAVALHALRRTLFHDPDATVRAAAATRFSQVSDGSDELVRREVASWLCDAAMDATPLVREAALRAVARLSTRHFERVMPTSAEVLFTRLALHDATWWVRRAAVLALFALRGAEALETLRRVLGDPFWRVRHTAVQALLSIGEADPSLRGAILRVSPELPSLMQAGLWYLRARWQPQLEVHAFPTPPPPDEELANPDPAVVTARLRARPPESLDPLELVPLLADPHMPLRVLAAQRLRTRPSLPALRAALPLLEIPGAPHAVETVSDLLDRLGRPARILCEEILRAAAPPSGAVIWASRYAATVEALDLRATLLEQLRADHDVAARVALIEALNSLTQPDATRAEKEQLVAALLICLHDVDVVVRSAAAIGLARFASDFPSEIGEALWSQPLDSYGPLAACSIVEAARRSHDLTRLGHAAQTLHPLPRIKALDALCRLQALSDAQLATCLVHPDPAVRCAVLRAASPAVWLRTLEEEIDPLLRRRALSLLLIQRKTLSKEQCRSAAALCSAAHDVWLRTRGCALLDAQDGADRPALMELLRDTNLAVRAAAASQFELAGDEDLFAELREELLQNPPFPVETELTSLRTRRALNDPATAIGAPRRMLGRTGIAVSPLGLSGAYDPPPVAMRQALRDGVNLVFWEPRYLGLARFLRRGFAENASRGGGIDRKHIVIAAGSFEGDRHGIERDLAQALRRLGTDHIDLFLLLWVRSEERLSDEVRQCLRDLKAQGRIRACGFSTHHRELAERAIDVPESERIFDVLMLRHSAAHPGAEDRLLPLCREREVGVITFSTLCYGRLLRAASASECYRYSLEQPGVSACWSAPRSSRELRENLDVLPSLATPLADETITRLRTFGKQVREEDRRFNALLRKGHEGAPEVLAALDLDLALDVDGAQGDDELYRGVPGIANKGAQRTKKLSIRS